MPAQGGVHHTESSRSQTWPGHVQAASKMIFSSKADTSFGAKKTVLLTVKWDLHHTTMGSKVCSLIISPITSNITGLLIS